MKKLYKYIALSALVLTTTCSSETILDEINDDNELVDVSFCAANSLQSRYTDTGFANGDKVIIYKVQDNNDFGEKKEFKYSNGKFLPVTDTFKKRKSETVTYIAFTSGYNESNGRLLFYGGSNDPLLSLAQTNNSQVELPFEHMHSQFRVNVTNNSYAVKSVQLLNAYNIEEFYYDEEDKVIRNGYDGSASTLTMLKDSSSSTYPYYYYLPEMNYIPDMKLKVTLTNGSSTTFSFKSDLGFNESNFIYYFNVNMSSRSNIDMSRSSEQNEVECVKVEAIE